MAESNGEMLDNVFQAIDTIVQKRISGLNFDKTLTCQIINIDTRDKGEYIVTDGSSTFKAYSDKTNYGLNSWVYVTVPNGDFNEKKLIAGKYIEGDASQYFTYVDPMETYVDVTSNLVSTANPVDVGLVANHRTIKEVAIWEQSAAEGEYLFANYDRLGLQANFLTQLENYNLVNGHYGLRVDIVSETSGNTEDGVDNKTTLLSYQLLLDSSDMFGNPYGFSIWSQQQQVYNISGIENIKSIKLTAYQKDDFYDINGIRLPMTDDNNQKSIYESIPNIRIKDVYLSLGYDLKNFTEDKVFLYSFQPSTYISYLAGDLKTKVAELYPGRDLNKQEDLNYVINDINKKTIDLRWVHLNTNQSAVSIDESTNGIIEKIDTYYPILFDENNKPRKRANGTYEVSNVETSQAIVHWYRWKFEEGIKNDLAGEFWEEQDAVKNQFQWIDFIPDSMKAYERIKCIVEYPSADYQRYQYYNDQVYLDLNNALTNHKMMNDNGEWVDYTGTNWDNSTVKQKIEQELQVLYTYYMSQVTYYKSEMLEFTNEHAVPDDATVDLVSALKIHCDVNGYNGVYRLYSDNGRLANEGEANRIRILSVEYNSRVTGDEKLDGAEDVTWYIPKNNTMIHAPQEGVEYSKYRRINVPDYAGLRELLNTKTIYYGLYQKTLVASNISETQYNEISQEPFYEEITANSDSYYKVEEDNEWYIIHRYGVEDIEGRAAGDLAPTEIEQGFRIKKEYNPNFINNTVKCTVTKNNRTYEAYYTMQFGPTGTKGTDYLLAAEYWQKKFNSNEWEPLIYPLLDLETTQEIKVIPHIYDYNNKDITEEYLDKISFNWYSEPVQALSGNRKRFNSNLNAVIEDNQVYCTLHNNGTAVYGANPATDGFYILEIKVETTFSGIAKLQNENVESTQNFPIILSTCIPIGMCNFSHESRKYSTYDGDYRIVYDTAGVNPVYYKGNFKLYQTVNGNLIEDNNINWKIYIGKKYGNSLIISNEPSTDYPQINATSGKLTVPSMYLLDQTPFVMIAGQVGNTNVFLYPLHIYKNVYDSAMLNSWDGSLTIDEKNGTILSAMVGAGYKDDENRFNGILMGDIRKTKSPSNKNTGLYGYHEGEQSFGFNVTGTAFIGKMGRGQIQFDGNSGEIKSASYDNPLLAGMRIDVDDGIIDMRSLGKTGSDYEEILLKDPNDKRQAWRTKHYYYKNNNGEYIWDDTQWVANRQYYYAIEDSDGNIVYKEIDVGPADLAYRLPYQVGKYSIQPADNSISDDPYDATQTYYVKKKTQSRVFLSTIGTQQEPYFRLVDDTDDNTTLFDAYNGVYYLQSSGFADADDVSGQNGKGVKFDLQNGSLKGYDFSLQAYQSTDDYAGSYISLNSNGNPFFKVHYSKTADNIDIDLMEISPSTFKIHSSNWNASNAGIELDLTGGKITAYDFNIEAIKTINSTNYHILLGSNATTYPLIIGTGTDNSLGAGDFAVNWDGSIKATYGTLGFWHVNTFGLFSESTFTENNGYQSVDGAALWSSVVGTNDDDLRISVGSVKTQKTYLHLSGPDSFTIITQAQYNAGISGDHSEQYMVTYTNSTADAGFMVLKDGTLIANTAQFKKAKGSFSGYFSGSAYLSTLSTSMNGSPVSFTPQQGSISVPLTGKVTIPRHNHSLNLSVTIRGTDSIGGSINATGEINGGGAWQEAQDVNVEWTGHMGYSFSYFGQAMSSSAGA